MQDDFTHLDSNGKMKMVDVSDKNDTLRIAKAYAETSVSKEVFNKIRNNTMIKGDVLAAARLAGIQAAKKTAELIPLCHNIFISSVECNFILKADKSIVEITAIVKSTSKTGVEMEALTAVSVAALTIYDMCKAIDRSITINNVHLLSKSGGKSGDYNRNT